MNHRFPLRSVPALLLGLACVAQAADPTALQAWPSEAKAQAVAWLPKLANGAELAAASKRDGLLLLDAQGQERARLAGRFESLDARPWQGGALLASFDREREQPLLQLVTRDGTWGASLRLPRAGFAVNGQCLYRDEASNLYLFLVGEDGQGEQWLVGHGAALAREARKVRRLALPPSAEQCRGDDADGTLYVDEAGIGLWAYGAHPEADGSRVPVDLKQPYGHLNGSVAGLAVVPGGLLALDKGPTLQRYQRQGEGWKRLDALPLDGPKKAEQLAAREQDGMLQVLLQDDASGRYYQGRVDALPPAAAVAPTLPSVLPAAQTESMARHGDAADDPAIWVNPRDPRASRVLGTNKQEGLVVFDLAGKQLQSLDAGLVNNVDLRYGFDFGGRKVDLAVASNRSDNSLTLFAIEPKSGKVSEIGRVPTGLDEVYGICLYSPRAGDIQAFVNDKDGRFQQYRLSAPKGVVKGELLREFRVASQPEGCVADDRQRRLFLGEEDVAVWTLGADPDAPGEPQQVLAVGEALHADVEGLALYHGAKASYLLVSSQGNDSYLVLDAQAPYRLRGAFRVGLNAAAGIDGSSETDGIEATSANLGGAFADGMFVVQDGRKRLPEGTQNFKYVPWAEIARALDLD
ncbi:phytase [Pseudomonas citronellolis]|uniref:phytase n=1 Tax=Pseudomonas citronellolis TaxID=53408 RepID=UPI0023E35EB0|nr:phytase [Pseudomonas citronellolis]MDF3933886.1 phytase [Pseudomonas citronellolis]